MNTRGLPGILAPTYQELQLGKIVSVGDRIHMSYPRISFVISSLDRRQAGLVEILDAFGDPVDVLLGGDDHVGQDRWASGAGDGEHVGEADNAKPEIGHRSPSPGLAQLLPCRPLISTFNNEPVMASKPVAKINTSSSCSVSPVRIPVAVMRSIG